MLNIPILLLAAGASSRMGQAKQLLPWGKKTLIEHQIDTILACEQPVFVVLGANHENILETIKHLPISILYHEKWANGMGESISFCISEMLNTNLVIDAIMIVLVDQPMVAKSDLQKLQNLYQANQHQIIISTFGTAVSGPPVIFDKFYFEELMQLKGDFGAKSTVENHKENVLKVEVRGSEIDLDTMEIYKQQVALNRQS